MGAHDRWQPTCGRSAAFLFLNTEYQVAEESASAEFHPNFDHQGYSCAAALAQGLTLSLLKLVVMCFTAVS